MAASAWSGDGLPSASGRPKGAASNGAARSVRHKPPTAKPTNQMREQGIRAGVFRLDFMSYKNGSLIAAPRRVVEAHLAPVRW